MAIPFEFYLPFVMNFARYFLLAGIPFMIFYVWFPDKFKTQKIQEQMARSKDFRRELRHSVKTILIFIGTALIILNTSLAGFSRMYPSFDDYPLWWIPVSLVLAMLIHDTYFYWMHRTIHDKRLFKWFHRVHHQSNNPSPLASYSFNLSEAVLEAIPGILILMLVPMHLLTILFYTLVIFAFNTYGHLGYEIMPKWFRKTILFECLVTSVHHNLHHQKFACNYGLYFRFWDRLMQTEYEGYVKEYDTIQAKRFFRSGNSKELHTE